MSRVIAALGVPKGLASRAINPLESPIAVVDGEDKVKATDRGPSRSAARRIAAVVWSSAASQPIGSHPGSGSPFGRVRRGGCRVVDELRCGTPLGAERLAGRTSGIGLGATVSAVRFAIAPLLRPRPGRGRGYTGGKRRREPGSGRFRGGCAIRSTENTAFPSATSAQTRTPVIETLTQSGR
jgi:hypothetical protein